MYWGPSMTKRIACLLFAVCATTVAHAEWIKVASSGGGVFFADPGSIRKSGDIAKMWSMFDLKNPMTIEGNTFSSGKAQDEYDCKEERTRKIYASYHTGHMGDGPSSSTEDESKKWVPVAPNSVAQALWKFACGDANQQVAISQSQSQSEPSDKPIRPIPAPPSATDAMGLFSGWIKGTMVDTSNGNELLYEIEKSRGKGGMWAANPKTGEVFKGQYTGAYKGGGYSFGTVSGVNQSGNYGTQNVQVFTPPSSANAQGYLKGDLGTVIEIFLEISPGYRPTGFGKGVDNSGKRYQVQF